MGRTIPSFRWLIEIEKLEWRSFRERLNKKDKELFNKSFSIPKLYCHALSNLSKPVVLDSIIISIVFNNFKSLLKHINETSVLMKNKTLEHKNNNSIKQHDDEFREYSTKDYFLKQGALLHQIFDDWQNFIECLSNEDKELFSDMVKSSYDAYRNAISSNIQAKDDLCRTRTNSLFMSILLYQQGQIKLLKSKQSFF